MAQTPSQPPDRDAHSISDLMPVVYRELRMLAARELGRRGDHRGRHTLQPTALVHEAFLKMAGDDKRWAGRDHFMAVAATAMRQVLVDHSRRKRAGKRGGGMARDAIDVEWLDSRDRSGEAREMRVLEIDRLLSELAESSPRAARVAEMRLFGGMEQEQMARALGISRMTVHRDWLVARAWLAAKVQDEHHD